MEPASATASSTVVGALFSNGSMAEWVSAIAATIALAQRLDNEREIDEGDKHEVEFVESAEQAAKALEPAE